MGAQPPALFTGDPAPGSFHGSPAPDSVHSEPSPRLCPRGAQPPALSMGSPAPGSVHGGPSPRLCPLGAQPPALSMGAQSRIWSVISGEVAQLSSSSRTLAGRWSAGPDLAVLTHRCRLAENVPKCSFQDSQGRGGPGGKSAVCWGSDLTTHPRGCSSLTWVITSSSSDNWGSPLSHCVTLGKWPGLSEPWGRGQRKPVPKHGTESQPDLDATVSAGTPAAPQHVQGPAGRSSSVKKARAQTQVNWPFQSLPQSEKGKWHLFLKRTKHETKLQEDPGAQAAVLSHQCEEVLGDHSVWPLERRVTQK